MQTITTIRAMQLFADGERRAGRTIGFVPTMGALHAGHLSLVREARRRVDSTVVSIFVNPIQFNSRSDFESYPRDDVRDADLLERATRALALALPRNARTRARSAVFSGVSHRGRSPHRR